METIIPEFKDDTDKAIIVIMLVLSIFGTFIPSMLVFALCKSMISESSYAIAKAFLNFEIVIVIGWIVLSFCNVLPILGQILYLIGILCLGLTNLIIVLKAIMATSKNEPVQVLVPLKLI